MSLLEAIVLGIVQGLTEFLPISSSAHLRIAGLFMPGAEDPGATFTAITQLGTEVAVLVFFWNRRRQLQYITLTKGSYLEYIKRSYKSKTNYKTTQ